MTGLAHILLDGLSLNLSADDVSAYGLVIGGSAVIILSYFANLLAKRTNVPSVLVLIAMGIAIRQGLRAVGLNHIPFEGLVLELLGTIGLIFIVLEAALGIDAGAQQASAHLAKRLPGLARTGIQHGGNRRLPAPFFGHALAECGRLWHPALHHE